MGSQSEINKITIIKKGSQFGQFDSG